MRAAYATYGENGEAEGAQSRGGWACGESTANRSGLRRVGFPRPVMAQVAKTMMAISIGGMKRMAWITNANPRASPSHTPMVVSR